MAKGTLNLEIEPAVFVVFVIHLFSSYLKKKVSNAKISKFVHSRIGVIYLLALLVASMNNRGPISIIETKTSSGVLDVQLPHRFLNK